MKGKKRWIAAAAAGIYLLLLWLLVLAEKNAPGANIVSFPEALWFSLTTLTTVGYGDLYPVTAAGRWIGAVFQLLSLGVLALLFGALIALLRGRLMPLLRIAAGRKKEWFVFSAATPETRTLADALRREKAGRLFLFYGKDVPSFGIRAPLDPEALCRRKSGGTAFFAMEEDCTENEQLARLLEGEPCDVYCMTSYEPDRLPARQRRFDPAEICARLYWHRYPLRSPREKIVLIGSGRCAEALLEQALQQNVRFDPQAVTYRVFGAFRNFRRNHPYLDTLFAAEEDGSRDSLLFMDGPWNGDLSLLREADRVIFCDDSEARNMERLRQLRRFCPVAGKVCARISLPFEGVETFGSREELFTPELVMRTKLNERAIRLNAIYRKSAGGNAPDWEELSSFTRRSNLASADHLDTKLQILLKDADAEFSPENCRRAYAVFAGLSEAERTPLRKLEHERWMRFHLLNNWQFAPVRDNAMRKHPLLVPFDALSPQDQAKDDYAWELLGRITD